MNPRSRLSLQEVLRARRALEARELLILLPHLARLVDEPDFDPAADLLSDVGFHARGGGEPLERSLAALPADQWPPFSLRLREKTSDELESTLVVNIPVQQSRVANFAATIYELLGGRLRRLELAQGRYLPLTALGEEGNTLLREALLDRGPTSGGALAEGLKAAVGRTRVAALVLPLEQVQMMTPDDTKSQVLELTSAVGHVTRIVSTSCFLIGRSRRRTHLSVSSLSGSSGSSDSETAEKVSRIHVRCELSGGQIFLRDGDGTRASTNGSFWNTNALDLERYQLLGGPGSLVLGPFPDSPLIRVMLRAGVTGASYQTAALPGSAPLGGVTFHYQRGDSETTALWLISETGCFVSDGPISWSTSAEAPLQLLNRDGRFWIGNVAAPELVIVDDQTLPAGSATALVDKGVIRVGDESLSIAIWNTQS